MSNRRFLNLLVGSTALAALLTGCGGSGTASNVFEESQWVTSEAGTTMFRGGRVTLTLPANAVTTNTKITLRNPPLTSTPFDVAILTDTEYEFTATTFASAATVGVSYDPSDIPDGFTESNLQVLRLSNGAWVTQTATADAANDRFTFSATTLGVYAIRVNGYTGG